MAAYTGTNLTLGKRGEVGQQYTALGYYSLAGGLANGDTITWTNLLPKGGCKVIAARFYGAELDSNATPTMLFTIGNSDDADGYLKSKGGAVQLINSLAGQLLYFCDGDLITGGTPITNRDVVFTVTAALATAVTSGTLFIELVLEGV